MRLSNGATTWWYDSTQQLEPLNGSSAFRSAKTSSAERQRCQCGSYHSLGPGSIARGRFGDDPWAKGKSELTATSLESRWVMATILEYVISCSIALFQVSAWFWFTMIYQDYCLVMIRCLWTHKPRLFHSHKPIFFFLDGSNGGFRKLLLPPVIILKYFSTFECWKPWWRKGIPHWNLHMTPQWRGVPLHCCRCIGSNGKASGWGWISEFTNKREPCNIGSSIGFNGI